MVNSSAIDLAVSLSPTPREAFTNNKNAGLNLIWPHAIVANKISFKT